MRIVTHTCSNTEIVCALGLGDQIVGVDDHSDHPPEVVAAAARIGPDLDVDVDRVRALEPDLVITSLTLPGHEHCVARLEAARLPILVVEPRSLDDVARDIETIAGALGAEAAGARLADAFRAALTPQRLPGPRPRVLVEWWPKPVIVPGRDSWVTQLLGLAGGVNPYGEAPVKSAPVSDAEVLEMRPDAVVISWCGVPPRNYRTEVVQRRPAWQALPALVNRRIYPISEAFLGRPGPRLVEGLEQLKRIVLECAVNPNAVGGN